MNNQKPKLLPCPFCGTPEPDIERSVTSEIEVQCLDCGALIIEPAREAAIAAWNRRTNNNKAKEE